jgi:hypothetical protein
MTCDDRAADSSLVARRRDNDHAFFCGLIQRLFERASPLGGGLHKGEAHVEDSRSCADASEDRRREVLGRRARHFLVVGWVFEDLIGQQGTGWADGRRRRAAFGEKNAGDECSVQTGHTIGLRAGAARFSAKLSDRAPGEIGVSHGDRAVDQPYRHLRTSGRNPHQCGESDQSRAFDIAPPALALRPPIYKYRALIHSPGFAVTVRAYYANKSVCRNA